MRGQMSIEAIAYIAVFLAILFLFISNEIDILASTRDASRMTEAKSCAESAALFADFYGLDGKLAHYEKMFGNARAPEGFVECEMNGNSARAKTLSEIYWSGGVLRVNASKKYPI
ncbi:MAG: hypothetical protein AB1468_02295 [Candidatus Micrarchaeota archaeon]